MCRGSGAGLEVNDDSSSNSGSMLEVSTSIVQPKGPNLKLFNLTQQTTTNS